MRKLFLSLTLAMLLAQPAHAGVLRKVLGAPFFAIGFAVALVADVTVVPLYNGATHYIYAPAVKGW